MYNPTNACTDCTSVSVTRKKSYIETYAMNEIHNSPLSRCDGCVVWMLSV